MVVYMLLWVRLYIYIGLKTGQLHILCPLLQIAVHIKKRVEHEDRKQMDGDIIVIG